MNKGYLDQGDPKVKMHDAHGHSNPHPVHGVAFGRKKAPHFAKGHKPMMKKEEMAEGEKGKGSAKEEKQEGE